MKRLSFLFFIIIAFIFTTSTGSGAKVIDFESVNPGTSVGTHDNPLVIDGFDFIYIGFGQVQQIRDWSGNNVMVDPYLDVYGAETRIWRHDGEPFILNSFEYGSMSGGSGGHAIHVRVYEYGSDALHHLELQPTTSGNILTGSDLGVEDVWIKELRINLVSGTSDFYYDHLNVTGGYKEAYEAGYQDGYDENSEVCSQTIEELEETIANLEETMESMYTLDKVNQAIADACPGYSEGRGKSGNPPGKSDPPGN